MIEYIVNEKEKITRAINFVNSIESDFPIPLSKQVNIEEYLKKLNKYGIIILGLDIERAGKVVGIFAGYANDGQTKIAYGSLLGVSNEYRHQGIASNLVKKFMEEAKNAGMIKINLEAYKNNNVAINMYKKLGFGEQKSIKASKDNKIILGKVL